jgi:hypothetical protein
MAARHSSHARSVICLLDGNRALWDMHLGYSSGEVSTTTGSTSWSGSAVPYYFHAEDSDQARQAVEERLRGLLRDESLFHPRPAAAERGEAQRLKWRW